MAQSAEPRSYAPNLSGQSHAGAVVDVVGGEDKPRPGPAERRGVAKLLRRQDTLREWIDEGRSDYELARSFHVPIQDVRAVIVILGIERPQEYEAAAKPERLADRMCSACGSTFVASQYRFRCDDCLEQLAKIHGEEFSVALGFD